MDTSEEEFGNNAEDVTYYTFCPECDQKTEVSCVHPTLGLYYLECDHCGVLQTIYNDNLN